MPDLGCPAPASESCRSHCDHDKPLLALLSSEQRGGQRGGMCGITTSVCPDVQSVHHSSVPQVTVGNREDSNILHICSAMPGHTGELTAAPAESHFY